MIDVGESTVKLEALFEPNLTATTPMKPVPLIVTVVRPASGPLCGLSFVIVGAAPALTYVKWSAGVVAFAFASPTSNSTVGG